MARSKHLPVPPRTDTDALVEAWGTRIDAPLLQLALVHRSYANEAGGIANNERLEFLGDSVLSIIIAQKLYEQYPDVAESDLSRMRAATVSQQPLAAAARPRLCDSIPSDQEPDARGNAKNTLRGPEHGAEGKTGQKCSDQDSTPDSQLFEQKKLRAK